MANVQDVEAAVRKDQLRSRLPKAFPGIEQF
jgi:hypothetical protein